MPRKCKNGCGKPGDWRRGGCCSATCYYELQSTKPKKSKKTKKPGVTREVADEIIERDHDRCRWCGGPREHLHHIVYRSQQGKHVVSNLICLCNACHSLVHTSVRVYRPVLLKLTTLPWYVLGKDIAEEG